MEGRLVPDEEEMGLVVELDHGKAMGNEIVVDATRTMRTGISRKWIWALLAVGAAVLVAVVAGVMVALRTSEEGPKYSQEFAAFLEAMRDPDVVDVQVGGNLVAESDVVVAGTKRVTGECLDMNGFEMHVPTSASVEIYNGLKVISFDSDVEGRLELNRAIISQDRTIARRLESASEIVTQPGSSLKVHDTIFEDAILINAAPNTIEDPVENNELHLYSTRGRGDFGSWLRNNGSIVVAQDVGFGEPGPVVFPSNAVLHILGSGTSFQAVKLSGAGFLVDDDNTQIRVDGLLMEGSPGSFFELRAGNLTVKRSIFRGSGRTAVVAGGTGASLELDGAFFDENSAGSFEKSQCPSLAVGDDIGRFRMSTCVFFQELNDTCIGRFDEINATERRIESFQELADLINSDKLDTGAASAISIVELDGEVSRRLERPEGGFSSQEVTLVMDLEPFAFSSGRRALQNAIDVTPERRETQGFNVTEVGRAALVQDLIVSSAINLTVPLERVPTLLFVDASLTLFPFESICVKSWKVKLGNQILQEVKSDLFEGCYGVCSISAPSEDDCPFYPKLFYDPAKRCVLISTLNPASIDLTESLCRRIENITDIEVPRLIEFELGVDSIPSELPLMTVNTLENDTAPALPTVFGPQALRFVPDTVLLSQAITAEFSSPTCLSSFRMFHKGVMLINYDLNSAAYTRCGWSCTRAFDSTSGCMRIGGPGQYKTVTLDLNGDNCESFSFSFAAEDNQDVCTFQTSIATSTELISNLNKLSTREYTWMKLELEVDLDNTQTVENETVILDTIYDMIGTPVINLTSGQTLEIFANLSVLFQEVNPPVVAGLKIELQSPWENSPVLALRDLSLRQSRIENHGGDVTIDNCDFVEGISGVGTGGCIYNDDYGVAKVFASSFTNCSSTGSGGAIANAQLGVLEVYGSTFTNNRAQFVGNAIANVLGGVALIDGSRFFESEALYTFASAFEVSSIDVVGTQRLFHPSSNDVSFVGFENFGRILTPRPDLETEFCGDVAPFESVSLNVTREACFDDCRADGECRFFVFDHVNLTCSKCREASCNFDCDVGSNTTLYEAKNLFRFVELQNICLANSTLQTFMDVSFADLTLDECKIWCKLYDACSLFTFESPNVCRLYSSEAVTSTCDTFAPGQVFLKFDANSWRFKRATEAGCFTATSTNLGFFSRTSLAECEELCNSRIECHGFDVVPGPTPSCNLYGDPTYSTDIATCGGTMRPIYLDVSFSFPLGSYSFVRSVTGVANPIVVEIADLLVDCERLCDARPLCLGFAFDASLGRCAVLGKEGVLNTLTQGDGSLPVFLALAASDFVQADDDDDLVELEGCQVATLGGSFQSETPFTLDQCKAVCLAHESCDTVLYSDEEPCRLIAPCPFPSNEIVYDPNVTDAYTGFSQVSLLTTFFQGDALRTLAPIVRRNLQFEIPSVKRGLVVPPKRDFHGRVLEEFAGCLLTEPLDTGIVELVTPDIDNCKRICDLDPQCVGVVLYQGVCKMKKLLVVLLNDRAAASGACEAHDSFLISTRDIVSDSNFIEVPDVVCAYRNVEATSIIAKSFRECEMACLEREGCGIIIASSGFEYETESPCSLLSSYKLTADDRDFCSEFGTAFLEYADIVFLEDENDVDPTDVLIADGQVANRVECESACGAYDTCRAFLFNRTTGWCSLFEQCSNRACEFAFNPYKFSPIPGLCAESSGPSEPEQYVAMRVFRVDRCMALCNAMEGDCIGLEYDDVQATCTLFHSLLDVVDPTLSVIQLVPSPRFRSCDGYRTSTKTVYLPYSVQPMPFKRLAHFPEINSGNLPSATPSERDALNVANQVFTLCPHSDNNQTGWPYGSPGECYNALCKSVNGTTCTAFMWIPPAPVYSPTDTTSRSCTAYFGDIVYRTGCPGETYLITDSSPFGLAVNKTVKQTLAPLDTLNVESYAECAALCNVHADGCRAFLFDNATSVCDLFPDLEYGQLVDDEDMGTRKLYMTLDASSEYTRLGSGLEFLQVSNPVGEMTVRKVYECMDACSQFITTCLGFSYDPNKKSCKLYDQIEYDVVPGAIDVLYISNLEQVDYLLNPTPSFAKMVGYRFQGGSTLDAATILGAAGFPVDTNNTNECAEACDLDPNCIAFEFNGDQCISFFSSAASTIASAPGFDTYKSYRVNPYGLAGGSSCQLTAHHSLGPVPIQGCFAACDLDVRCLAFGYVESNGTCVLSTTHPTGCTNTTADIVQVYADTEQFQFRRTTFRRPETEIAQFTSATTLVECATLCNAVDQCKAMEFDPDTNTCRFNTYENTVVFYLMGDARDSVPALRDLPCLGRFDDPDSVIEFMFIYTGRDCRADAPYNAPFKFYYSDGLLRYANDETKCLSYAESFPDIDARVQLQTCPDVLLDPNFQAVWELVGEGENIFKIKDQNLCLKVLNNADLRVEACDTPLGNNDYRSMLAYDPTAYTSGSDDPIRDPVYPSVDLYLRNDALEVEIANPNLQLQLFLRTDAGKASLDIMSKISNMERVASRILNRMIAVTDATGSILNQANIVLAPLELAQSTVLDAGDVVGPIASSLNVLRVVKIVGTVIRITRIDTVMNAAKTAFKTHGKILDKAITKLRKLLIPLEKLDGLLLASTLPITSFAEGDIWRKLVRTLIKAQKCAADINAKVLLDGLDETLVSFGQIFQSITAALLRMEFLLQAVENTVDELKVRLETGIALIVQRFTMSLQGLDGILDVIRPLLDIFNIYLFCLPEISFRWTTIPIRIDVFGIHVGTIRIPVPEVKIMGELCLPLAPICVVLNGLVDGIGFFLWLFGISARKMLQGIKDFIARVIGDLLSFITGGLFRVDWDKCLGCIVFGQGSGKCYRVSDVVGVLESILDIVQRLFYPVLKFLLDTAEQFIVDALFGWFPEIDFGIPSLELDVDFLDTDFDFFDTSYNDFLREMTETVENATNMLTEGAKGAMPAEFEIPCDLGADVLASAEVALGISSNNETVNENTTIEEQTALVEARGSAVLDPQTLVSLFLSAAAFGGFTPADLVKTVVTELGVNLANRFLARDDQTNRFSTTNRRVLAGSRGNRQASKEQEGDKLRERFAGKWIVTAVGIDLEPVSSFGTIRRQLATTPSFYAAVAVRILGLNPSIGDIVVNFWSNTKIETSTEVISDVERCCAYEGLERQLNKNLKPKQGAFLRDPKIEPTDQEFRKSELKRFFSGIWYLPEAETSTIKGFKHDLRVGVYQEQELSVTLKIGDSRGEEECFKVFSYAQKENVCNALKTGFDLIGLFQRETFVFNRDVVRFKLVDANLNSNGYPSGTLARVLSLDFGAFNDEKNRKQETNTELETRRKVFSKGYALANALLANANDKIAKFVLNGFEAGEDSILMRIEPILLAFFSIVNKGKSKVTQCIKRGGRMEEMKFQAFVRDDLKKIVQDMATTMERNSWEIRDISARNKRFRSDSNILGQVLDFENRNKLLEDAMYLNVEIENAWQALLCREFQAIGFVKKLLGLATDDIEACVVWSVAQSILHELAHLTDVMIVDGDGIGNDGYFRYIFVNEEIANEILNPKASLSEFAKMIQKKKSCKIETCTEPVNRSKNADSYAWLIVLLHDYSQYDNIFKNYDSDLAPNAVVNWETLAVTNNN